MISGANFKNQNITKAKLENLLVFEEEKIITIFSNIHQLINILSFSSGKMQVDFDFLESFINVIMFFEYCTFKM